MHPGEAYRVRLMKNSTYEKGQKRFYCFEGLTKDLINKFGVTELKHTLSQTREELFENSAQNKSCFSPFITIGIFQSVTRIVG